MKDYLEQYKFTEIAEINDVHDIHITEEVRDRCADNYCGFYGRNHMCPPAVGALSFYRELIESYCMGLVFSKAYTVKSRRDYQGMLDAGVAFRDLVQEISRTARKDHRDCLFFTAGTCGLCEKCAILDDEPCRFPEDTMPSLEAAGIDVVRLCRDLGMKYNNGEDKVTYFGLVLYR